MNVVDWYMTMTKRAQGWSIPYINIKMIRLCYYSIWWIPRSRIQIMVDKNNQAILETIDTLGNPHFLAL